MDNFKLTVLGCGTTAIDSRKGCPGFLLECGGRTILLDSGCGTLHRLAGLGVGLQDLDILCFSHHHPDHISDLLPFLHSVKWDPSIKKRPVDITIIAPPSVQDYYYQLILFYQDSISPDDRTLKVNLRNPLQGKIKEGGIDIESLKVAHTEDSVGYRFSCGSKTFGYSGDAQLDNNLIKLASGCDLFLCECSFPNSRRLKGHMCPEDVRELWLKAKPEKLLLTHIYPQWTKQEKEELDSMAALGNIVRAEDLKSVVI